MEVGLVAWSGDLSRCADCYSIAFQPKPDPRDALIDSLRAEVARLAAALADEEKCCEISIEQRDAALRDREAAIADRDARPNITREQAKRYLEWRNVFAPHPTNRDRLEPIDDALRAHARGER